MNRNDREPRAHTHARFSWLIKCNTTNDFPISFFKFQLYTNTCHEFPDNETRSSFLLFLFFLSRAFPVHNMARPNPIDYATQRNPV